MIYVLFAVLLLGVYGQTENDCLDAVPTCAKLAELGYCEKNTLVRQRCRSSCNTDKCKDGDPTPPPTPSPVGEEECEKLDTSTTCPRLAELGYCEKNELVRRRCMKSCDSPCPEDPEDPTPAPTPKPVEALDCRSLKKRECTKEKFRATCAVRYNKFCDNRKDPWVPETCTELSEHASKKVCERIETSDEGKCLFKDGKCVAIPVGTKCKKLKLTTQESCKKVLGCRWGRNKKDKGKCKGKVRKKK